jgi:signal transduction histidine kinase
MRRIFQSRLQLQLFLILFSAISVAALSVLLIWDSVHSAERVVVSDMGNQMSTALAELGRQFMYRSNSDSTWQTLSTASRDISLRGISEVVLRPYSGVEGGFYEDGGFLGYAFPTHDNPSAKTEVPSAERSVIEEVVHEALEKKVAQRLLPSRSELVLVSASRIPGQDAAAWTMQRRSRQTATTSRSLLLVALVLGALLSVGGTLRMALSLRRGVSQIQGGLASLESDFEFTLPAGNGELGEISSSINRMATVRRRLEEELRREDRLRVVGRTVAGFAHEIRNPLNGVRLSMQVLEQRLRKGSIQASDLTLVMSEVDRMDALLTDLLAFRKGKMAEVSTLDVLPIVRRCVELARPKRGETEIEICALNGPPDTEAASDPARLTQAILNLLLNAVEASGANGHVVVTVRRVNQKVEIEIHDSGPGLNEEQRKHIFEAFYTTKPNGTGLGLAVSRQLVTEMGGDLFYVNSSKGACFIVSAPAASDV